MAILKCLNLPAHSCGGSHGFGPLFEGRTMFPFHPAVFGGAGNHRSEVYSPLGDAGQVRRGPLDALRRIRGRGRGGRCRPRSGFPSLLLPRTRQPLAAPFRPFKSFCRRSPDRPPRMEPMSVAIFQSHMKTMDETSGMRSARRENPDGEGPGFLAGRSAESATVSENVMPSPASAPRSSVLARS